MHSVGIETVSKIRVKFTPEGENARKWRERRKLTVLELSERTGFSETSIYMFERGARQDGKKLSKHSEFAWQRYQMVCAAVDAEEKTGRRFEW